MILAFLISLEITTGMFAITPKIGCIDIKAIFEEFPETQKARQEYQQLMNEKQFEIKTLEDEIDKLKLEIEEIKKTLSLTQEPGTSTVLNEKQMLLEQKTIDLDLKKKRLESELQELSRIKTAKVMGKLYRIIEEVAIEEGLSVVIDKADAIWFSESIDITDAVRKKLHGK
ncbi:MAG: OmpH family outer membrane protein [bacterium]|nr:OmpH family outer membrane protein [bacterium]